MNRYTNVLLLSTLMMHGACAMSYFFGNGSNGTKKKAKNSEIEQVKKRIFAVHELAVISLDNLSKEEFIESFNKLPDEEKIYRAKNGVLFNNPETGHLYRSLAQLSEKELQTICRILEIPTYWAK